MWNDEQWKEWFAWHKEWKRQRDQAYKEIKKQYPKSEWEAIHKSMQKSFMREFWENRQRILGH